MMHYRSQTFSGIAREGFQVASAYLILLLPKCSICLAAYLNVFSLFGLSVAKYSSWIVPILSLVVISSLVVSFLKARKVRDYRGFGLLLIGSLLLLAGKIWFTNPALGWAGFAVIGSATIVQLFQSRKVCDQDILKF